MNQWLVELEQKKKIEVLFACEGGSRAWKTNLSSSDYDIRFIYIVPSLKHYLSLNKREDGIYYTNPDASGWDILKAFQLLNKSNPSLYEWAFSPIVYKNKDHFQEKLRKIVEENYSSFSLASHYFNIGKKNVEKVKRIEIMKEKDQKNLLHGVRSIILLRSLINEEIKDPFQVMEDCTGKWKDYYELLVRAKLDRKILPTSQITEIIAESESFLSNNKEQIQLLSKGKRMTRVLNEWLWELFDL